jgi:hypothetical protein
MLPYMEQNIMLYLVSITTALMWISVLLLYLILQKVSTKISDKSSEDIGEHRCKTARKQMAFMKKMHKFFIVMLVIFSINFVIGLISRSMLIFGDSSTGNLTLGQILIQIIKPVSILSVAVGLAAYLITKMILGYYEVLINKCKALSIIEE